MTSQTQGVQASAEHIINMANMLIDTNGTTTTLDVKNALRNLSFTVRQMDVSDVMDARYEDEGWEWEYAIDGNYRVYSKPSMETDESDNVDADNDGQAFTNFYDTSAPQTASKLGRPITINIQPLNASANNTSRHDLEVQYGSDCWVVYHINNLAPIAVYDSTHTRDEVRSHYRRINGVQHTDTRASRLKNYK
jgi:hypothetical protein